MRVPPFETAAPNKATFRVPRVENAGFAGWQGQMGAGRAARDIGRTTVEVPNKANFAPKSCRVAGGEPMVYNIAFVDRPEKWHE